VRIDEVTESEARAILGHACGSERWVREMLARRPFGDGESLLRAADEVWAALSEEDWREAFAHHPRIGADLDALKARFQRSAREGESNHPASPESRPEGRSQGQPPEKSSANGQPHDLPGGESDGGAAGPSGRGRSAEDQCRASARNGERSELPEGAERARGGAGDFTSTSRGLGQSPEGQLRASPGETGAAFLASSAREQAAVAEASEETLVALRDGNVAYETKHGFVFLVCATGKSADEMLALLRARLPRDTATELRTAAREQAKITRLRLAAHL